MLEFQHKTVNRGFHTAQHYRGEVVDWGESERTLHKQLIPSVSWFEAGSCGGMVLSWIRNVHTKQSLTTPPNAAESTAMQYLTAFGKGSRDYAYDTEEWPAEYVIEQLHAFARNASPTSVKRRRKFLKAYRSIGFRSAYRGQFGPIAIMDSLIGHGAPDAPRTYLLTAQSHGTALAVTRNEIAFFDPNHGIAIMPRERALHYGELLLYLRSVVARGNNTKIAVTELSYFDGVNRRRHRFGEDARPYERGQSSQDDSSDDFFESLARLWGGSES